MLRSFWRCFPLIKTKQNRHETNETKRSIGGICARGSKRHRDGVVTLGSFHFVPFGRFVLVRLRRRVRSLWPWAFLGRRFRAFWFWGVCGVGFGRFGFWVFLRRRLCTCGEKRCHPCSYSARMSYMNADFLFWSNASKGLILEALRTVPRFWTPNSAKSW